MTAILSVERLEHRRLLAAVGVGPALEMESVQSLDVRALRGVLEVPTTNESRRAAVKIDLPTPQGERMRFVAEPTDVMHPDLAAKFPEIKTFRATALDDPARQAFLTLTPDGVRGQVISSNAEWTFAPTFTTDDAPDQYRVAFVGAGGGTGGGCGGCGCCGGCCGFGYGTAEAMARSLGAGLEATFAPTGPVMRNYRLAVATTGEFAQQWGGNRSQALAAIVSTIAVVDGIFERDLAVSFQLAANNDLIIFTDPATDPYSGTAGSTADLDVNQLFIDEYIGRSQYDIGHLFGAGNQGVVTGLINNPNTKARGGTWSTPGNADSAIFITAHEMGHQFGASHTWNSPDFGNQWVAGAAVEPGNGSTLMSYADLGGASMFQDFGSRYFNAFSLQQMNSLISSALPPSTTATGNAAPSVNAGTDFVVPRGTAYVLRGSASDTAGQTLSWAWEQQDLGPRAALTAPESGQGPLVRSRLQYPGETTAGGTQFGSFARTVPAIDTLLSGAVDSSSERLSNVARTLNFNLTVRDQLGGVATDAMTITVDPAIGPFQITAPTTPQVWSAGTTQTVTWSVNGTNVASVGGELVNIYWSIDGGTTFSLLLGNTPNDGSQAITVPASGATVNARFMIAAASGIFFDISPVPIKVGDTTIVGSVPATFLPTSAEGYLITNQFNDSGDVQVGSNANITAAGDTDGFVFVPRARGRYTFDVAAAGGSGIDTVAAVYDSAGNLLAVNDDALGTLNSRVSLELAPSTLYTLVVAGFQGTRTGDVSITINGESEARQGFGLSLDRFGNGTSPQYGFTTGREGALFNLVSPRNASGALTLVSNHSFDADLFLYDETGALVAQASNAAAGSETLTVAPGIAASSTYTAMIVSSFYRLSGAFSLGVDFGTVQALALGRTWNDTNRDGLRNPGESDIGGITIWADINDNGTFDAGEPSAVSDVANGYTLAVPPDPVRLYAIPNADWVHTIPGFGTPITVDIPSGVIRQGFNFGFYQGASESGRIWSDTNRNAVVDPGEPLLSNFRIFIDSAGGNGTWDVGEPFAFSDVNGNWSIRGIREGPGMVRAEMKLGYGLILPASGGYVRTWFSGQAFTTAFFTAEALQDYGDAPASYGTLRAANGPRHDLLANFQLGAANNIEGELDGAPSTGADGDDLAGVDDEDAIGNGYLTFAPGSTAQYTVFWWITGRGTGRIGAWVDFNRDGDFLDANEALPQQALTSNGNGFATLTVSVPSTAVLGQTYMRIRLTDQASIGPTGYGGAGEVEDHRVGIGRVPGAIMNLRLDAASDTGVSNSDRITRDNTPTLLGTTEANATVRIFEGTTLVGSGVAAGDGTFSITTSALSDGARQLRVIASNITGDGNTTITNVTIDTAAPTATATAFDFETGHRLRYTFSEAMGASTIDPADALANRTGGGSTAASSVNYNATTREATFTFNPLLIDGNYTSGLLNGGLTDVAGNTVSQSPVAAFHVLAGDANRDRNVNFDDLLILAANYNQTTGTFSQGNFNYLGGVDFDDLLLLAANYNRTIATAAAPITAPPPSLFGSTNFGDEPIGEDVLA